MRTEKPLLGPLPRLRFDTARKDSRVVGRVPLAEWDGVFYSAPPEAAGHVVEARQAVDSTLLQLRLGGRLIAEHRIAAPGSDPQWLPEHRAAAEAIALGRHGRHLRAVEAQPPPPPPCGDLDLGDGDYDVEDPDLGVFDLLGPEPTAEAAGEDGVGGCGCFGGLR
jgi:hypothetical protein